MEPQRNCCICDCTRGERSTVDHFNWNRESYFVAWNVVCPCKLDVNKARRSPRIQQSFCLHSGRATLKSDRKREACCRGSRLIEPLTQLSTLVVQMHNPYCNWTLEFSGWQRTSTPSTRCGIRRGPFFGQEWIKWSGLPQ